MFADDTTLFSKSRQGMKKMLRELTHVLGKIGLNLNADKCKLQCSRFAYNATGSLEVDGILYPIVAKSEGFKVLVTIFTLDGRVDVEFQSRINAAWAKFWSLWKLLGKRDADLKRRLKLLQTVVAMVLLWCSETWTLTVKQKRKLRSVQRAMLRKVVCTRRWPEEEYVPWIRRATRKSEEVAKQAGVKCWLIMHMQAKWRWAQELATMGSERWAARTTFWRDSAWWAYQPRGGSSYGARPMRARPGNLLRWEDDLRKYAEHCGWSSWQDAAQDKASWEKHEEAFIKYSWR